MYIYTCIYIYIHCPGDISQLLGLIFRNLITFIVGKICPSHGLIITRFFLTHHGSHAGEWAPRARWNMKKKRKTSIWFGINWPNGGKHALIDIQQYTQEWVQCRPRSSNVFTNYSDLSPDVSPQRQAPLGIIITAGCWSSSVLGASTGPKDRRTNTSGRSPCLSSITFRVSCSVSL